MKKQRQISEKQKIKLSVALLVLSLGLIGLTFLGNSPADQVLVGANVGAPVHRSTAPGGQVVAGFPQSLILDSNKTVEASYKLDYSTAAQYTVELLTSASVKTEYQKYLDYLQSNLYNLVYKKSGTQLAAIYAKTEQGDIGVQISKDQTNHTKVIINYLKK